MGASAGPGADPQAAGGRAARALGLPDLSQRGWLVAAVVVDTLGEGLFLPIALLFFTVSTALPVSGLGLTISMATIVALAASPAMGSLTDRLGPRRAVVMSNLLTAAGYALYPAVSTYPGVFGCVFVVMVADRLYFAALPTLLSMIAKKGELDGWFALSQAVAKGAFATGALLGSLLIGDASFGSLMVLVYLDVATCLVAAALTASIRLPPGAARAERVSRAASWAEIGHDRAFRRIVATQLLLAFAWAVLPVFLPLYLVRYLALPPGLAMVAFGINSIIVLASQTWVTRRLQRLRRTQVIVAGAVLFDLSLIVFAAVPAAGPSWAEPFVVVLGVLIFTAGEMFCAPAFAALAAGAAPAHLRGRYMSIFGVGGGVAFGLGPGLVGALYDVSPHLALLGLGVCIAAGATLLRCSQHLLPSAAVRSVVDDPGGHHGRSSTTGAS